MVGIVCGVSIAACHGWSAALRRAGGAGSLLAPWPRLVLELMRFNSRCRTRIGRLVRAGKSDTSALVMPAASDPPARRRQPAPPLQRSSREPYLKFGLGTVSERNGCSGPQPRLSESARADGSVAGISYSNFPNELAPLCDSAGKSRAWRGLDAATPFHFDRDIC